jgi:hypothetical protein
VFIVANIFALNTDTLIRQVVRVSLVSGNISVIGPSRKESYGRRSGSAEVWSGTLLIFAVSQGVLTRYTSPVGIVKCFFAPTMSRATPLASILTPAGLSPACKVILRFARLANPISRNINATATSS